MYEQYLLEELFEMYWKYQKAGEYGKADDILKYVKDNYVKK